MKVVTILGTRPEIIRLSSVLARLDKHVEHVLVHTGQNYDYELNEVFFKDLNVKKPDYFMNVDTSSLGKVYGGIMIATEEILKKEKPDAVLILGDTNSSIAGIITKRMKIPIFHMEAGNRSFDFNVPEETNRRIIDHTSDFNLCYTEHARRHLIAEGLPHRRIYVTGSPMREVLLTHLDNIKASKILDELKLTEKKYFLASIHREENVDQSGNLTQLIDAMEALVKDFGFPVIVSTHPRTKKRLQKLGRTDISKKIKFLKPFGFLDYVKLQMKAACVISDSGTICEESSMLNFPAITVRNAIERPEAMDAGSIVVTGLDSEIISQAVKLQMSADICSKAVPIPNDYQIENTSERVVKLILGTAKLSNLWDGIKYNDLA
ncbi:MAG: UDP-N-acetylglucosamine 2-epimerase (non-hydrolyzing) [Planctomycetota bacterium]|nr:MAG: UDP-N-acetylglucosamine 2-epimerase (non-hydrolyzing) [Planctomycetota bacterium]